MTFGSCHDADALQWSMTPLHRLAEREGSIEVAELLLAAGANMDATNWFGRTPLHVASQYHPSLAMLLISKGADVNATDQDEYTPLHSFEGSIEVAELLLAAGADLEATNWVKNQCPCSRHVSSI
eukprot:TRINITY_DN12421_c1_g3_i1.p2 TRINITY_DN12421_c1_g3~~TRINITY_DN12421_c1_g3_i1.p2  ORF type:complete len:125 (+),score=13.72 TRINITY_DN12421_c1_g3_i1:717-1091(+)